MSRSALDPRQTPAAPPPAPPALGTIDDEHLLLAAIIHELRTAMARGDGRAGCEAIFGRVVDYASRHFQHEEALMREAGYPDWARHRDEHQGFILRLRELAADLRKQRAALSMDVLDFLQSWLKHHVEHSDRHFVSFAGDRA